MPVDNAPIVYEFHSDAPLGIPFAQIAPEDIHIYLNLDTKIGKDTCGQRCEHCWFVNYDDVYDMAFDMTEGPHIKNGLEALGYRVFPRYVDSFGYQGKFLSLFGSTNNREFRQESQSRATDTMESGDAWTSGRPLLGDGYVELLDLAKANGYGTISTTFHGLLDDDLRIVDGRGFPLKGVLRGSDLEKVVHRIHDYNERHAGAAPDDGTAPRKAFRVNITVTLGRHNTGRPTLERYARYFNALGVDTVRFNNYADHGGHHPELELSREEIARTFEDLKWLHDCVQLDFQLGVSGDFGDDGLEVLGIPSHVGWCRGGSHLFTVIPSAVVELSRGDGVRHEKIGDIVGCVNMFEPHFGPLVRTTDEEAGTVTYDLLFDHEAIDAFTADRMSGVYQNGCFARELARKLPPPRRVQAGRGRPVAATGEPDPCPTC